MRPSRPRREAQNPPHADPCSIRGAAPRYGVHPLRVVLLNRESPVTDVLPRHVERWVEHWAVAEFTAPASIGFFSIAGNDSDFEGKAQSSLRKLARRTNRGFVAVRDLLWGP